MAYTKRDWDNTSNEVTKEDFKRIEDGIETNDKQINVLNRVEDIPIVYLNGFAQIWGGQWCRRVGNTVEVYLEINSENAIDLYAPITILKYKPYITTGGMFVTADNGGDPSSVHVVANPDGTVQIHSWSVPNLKKHTMAHLKYTTLDAFS